MAVFLEDFLLPKEVDIFSKEASMDNKILRQRGNSLADNMLSEQLANLPQFHYNQTEY